MVDCFIFIHRNKVTSHVLNHYFPISLALVYELCRRPDHSKSKIVLFAHAFPMPSVLLNVPNETYYPVTKFNHVSKKKKRRSRGHSLAASKKNLAKWKPFVTRRSIMACRGGGVLFFTFFASWGLDNACILSHIGTCTRAKTFCSRFQVQRESSLDFQPGGGLRPRRPCNNNRGGGERTSVHSNRVSSRIAKHNWVVEILNKKKIHNLYHFSVSLKPLWLTCEGKSCIAENSLWILGKKLRRLAAFSWLLGSLVTNVFTNNFRWCLKMRNSWAVKACRKFISHSK